MSSSVSPEIRQDRLTSPELGSEARVGDSFMDIDYGGRNDDFLAGEENDDNLMMKVGLVGRINSVPSVSTARNSIALARSSSHRICETSRVSYPSTNSKTFISPRGSIGNQHEISPARGVQLPGAFSETCRSCFSNSLRPVRYSTVRSGGRLDFDGALPSSAVSRRSSSRAVLIALTYVNTKGLKKKLGHDIGHVQALFDMLTDRAGFRREDIWVLTDAPGKIKGSSVQIRGTRHNILSAMKWLVGRSRAGDNLFFGFSGLGIELKKCEYPFSLTDECMIPCDYPHADAIRQDTIASMLLEELHPHATLTGLFDCKRGHNMLLLPYIHVSRPLSRRRWTISETLQYKEAVPERLKGGGFSWYGRSKRQRRFYMDMRRRVAEGEREMLATAIYGCGRVVMFSGCGDHLDFTNGDALTSIAHGQLTTRFVDYVVDCLDGNEPICYKNLLEEVGKSLGTSVGFQMLQASMSHRVSLNRRLFFL